MTMNNMFKKLFTPIKAEEKLKNQTKAYLIQKTQNYTKIKHRNYSFSAAVCACFLFILFGGHQLYFTPTAKISIDINPSLEMSINRFDQVIFINDFNEDGQKLSHELDIKYKNYTTAIQQILNNHTIAALLSHNEVMIITVTGSNGSQSAKILSGVEKWTTEQCNTYCYFISPEEAASAHEIGLSCGKYKAFLELQLLDPHITSETVQGMTMREIRDLIDSLSSNQDYPSSDQYDNQGNGHHRYRYGGGHKQRETQ